MTNRVAVARIPVGQDELVVSIDEHDRIDLRIWTRTGDLKFPSKHGVTVPRHALRDLIDALMAARRRDAA
jgi:hypothetical protein